MFSPTLFHDYYTTNDYIVNEIYLYSYRADNLYGFWTLYEYFPGALHKLQLGGLDNKMYGYIVYARKQKLHIIKYLNKQCIQKIYGLEIKIKLIGITII